MTSPASNPSRNIIVGVDGSPLGEHAVLWAAEEARLQHRGLTLVHAEKQLTLHQQAWFVSAQVPVQEIAEDIREHAERAVNRAHSLACERFPDLGIETLLEIGDARTVLLEHSEGSPMVVVGSRGHGRVVGLLLGSVSGALVRHATCPIAVVRPISEGRRGVLVGADGSEASMVPLEYAFAEAAARELPLTVVHCLWEPLVGHLRWAHVDRNDPEFEEARLRLAESLAGMADKYPDVPVHLSVTRGAIDACLVDLSQQHDLLVIGRPPHSLGERLVLPGLVITVAEHAHAPVIVVP
jgi:nucleotide-binding universal stress UspA family protein